VDVDLGAVGARDAKRAARQVNLEAIAQCARLLRLKAQGGLVVLDLVGRGHDGQALAHALRMAFAPDQPGAAFGPVSRFGTIELALARRFRPVADVLCDADGKPSVPALAYRLLRALEREALADPGGRITARAAPEVALAAFAGVQALEQRFGARFLLTPDPVLAREAFEVSSR
jgi:Ribonuclease G/E